MPEVTRRRVCLLWTFLSHPGIPLTNNAAERALRPYVIGSEKSAFSVNPIEATSSAR
jgi:hypothetical protein